MILCGILYSGIQTVVEKWLTHITSTFLDCNTLARVKHAIHWRSHTEIYIQTYTCTNKYFFAFLQNAYFCVVQTHTLIQLAYTWDEIFKWLESFFFLWCFLSDILKPLMGSVTNFIAHVELIKISSLKEANLNFNEEKDAPILNIMSWISTNWSIILIGITTFSFI